MFLYLDSSSGIAWQLDASKFWWESLPPPCALCHHFRGTFSRLDQEANVNEEHHQSSEGSGRLAVDLCILFCSSHMKSSRGLNIVSTRLHNHFSNSVRVALSLRLPMCSYHFTQRFIGNCIVALLGYSGVCSITDCPILTHHVVQAFTR